MIRQSTVNATGPILGAGGSLESKPLRHSVSNRERIVMAVNKHPLMKRLVLAGALAVCISGMARADDSSMNPFIGESYSAFNGGNERTKNSNPTFDPTPAAWRMENPNGLPERVLQSYSGFGEVWKVSRPDFASVASDPSFKQDHPGGLTEPELQALSSDAPAWEMAATPGTAGAKQARAALPQNLAQEPLGERIAKFFHASHAGSAG